MNEERKQKWKFGQGGCEFSFKMSTRSAKEVTHRLAKSRQGRKAERVGARGGVGGGISEDRLDSRDGERGHRHVLLGLATVHISAERLRACTSQAGYASA
jgi:hypothetical protein